MKQKIKIIVSTIGVIVVACTAIAVTIMPFSGWDHLTKKSPDIILVRCTKTPAPHLSDTNEAVNELRGGLIDSEIEVMLVLKGTTNKAPARLRSQYLPRQGEQYLIFGHFGFGLYQAFETYRVVPLGTYFPTNVLLGKSLDEQIQVGLKWRLDRLNAEFAEKIEEKKRLEEGVKK